MKKLKDKPFAVMVADIEDAQLVEDMLAELEKSSAALPLLQFTATKLWEARDRNQKVLTEASYRAIGGVG